MPLVRLADTRRLWVVVAVIASVVGLGIDAVEAESGVVMSSSSETGATSAFTAVDPVRVLGADQPVAVTRGRIQYLTLAGRFGQPSDVSAARLVLTVAPTEPGVEITVHPSGGVVPLVATVRAGEVGRPVVRSINVAVGTNGQIEFRTSGGAVLTVDLVGVYRPASSSSAGRYVSIDPVSLGQMDGREIDFAVPASVPADVEAVLVSMTAWNAPSLGTWSRIDDVPSLVVGPGRIEGGEVLVRVVDGRVRLRSNVTSRVALDLVGWFTGPSAPVSADGLYVATAPTRLLDTTTTLNPLGAGVALHERWAVENSLAAFSAASAVDVRIGMHAAHGAGSVAVYASGRGAPTYGQVHAPLAGAVDVAHATVRAATRGVAAYSSGGTDLTLDVVGWYTGSRAVSDGAKPVNVMPSGHDFPGLIAIPRTRTLSYVLHDPDLVDIDPVHLPESRSPNQPGNTAIFGHRTSHGREFRNIDRLRVGDPVYLAVGGRIYVYSTTSVEVLSPQDPRLYASSSNDQTLTLVACHPPGSIKFRVVAFARLVDTIQF